MYPKLLVELIQDLQLLSGVGVKSAERYALEILNWNEEDILKLANDLVLLPQSIKRCKICNHLTDEDICDICSDPLRDKQTICVVAYPKDIWAIEKAKEYNGVYHVLDGVISTARGVFPDDLKIDMLVERCKGDIKEVILAISPTIEGETTALYLQKRLEPLNINVTKIAQGLPMGASLDYADELTIFKALQGRK